MVDHTVGEVWSYQEVNKRANVGRETIDPLQTVPHPSVLAQLLYTIDTNSEC